ncbi:hypothetical protein HS088_TW12G01061 [Tripterygium wilfordii]|uniref:Uncharacterized GPI-anchored protein At5g19230-like domain-containing protein n=1 Tax=Tripterygium wilfordii TaxID=458696 RepID=A0A7J7D0L7_TRIWF|nr:hypothetical protein HS088_TW12G01061 [Tripterygium wilfordii]
MAMAFPKITVFFFVILPAILLLSSSTVKCDEVEDNLLQGINSYRTSQNLQPLAKNNNANCLADEIADDLEDQPCSPTASTTPQLSSYRDQLSKCKIDPNTTTDAVVLPVCVRDLVPTLVLTNYTRTRYARYLNDSKYTRVGVGSEDDWMVVILTTDTPTGSFTNGAAAMAAAALVFGRNYMVTLLVVLFLFLVK